MKTQMEVNAVKPVEPMVLFIKPMHSLSADPRTGSISVVVKSTPVVRA